MAISNPVYDLDEVSQEFDLEEILGYKPNEVQKKRFGELVIDRIIDRTASNQDINGDNFTDYSPSYAEKKGVSENSVDMILDGDMLNSLRFKKDRRSSIVRIEVSGDTNIKKSYNHCVGDTLPQRTWFGVKEEEDILDIISSIDGMKNIRGMGAVSIDQVREKKENDLASIRAAINKIRVDFEGF